MDLEAGDVLHFGNESGGWNHDYVVEKVGCDGIETRRRESPFVNVVHNNDVVNWLSEKPFIRHTKWWVPPSPQDPDY